MGTPFPESLFPPLSKRPPPTVKSSSQPPVSVWNSPTSAMSSHVLPLNVLNVADGTTNTAIPALVRESAHPLWEKFVVGYFIGDSPHIGSIHAIVKRIWNTSGQQMRIDAQFISKSTVLFKFKSITMRECVLKRKYWYIADSTLVVQPWNPCASDSKPDLTAMPIWVDFRCVPDYLFSEKGLMSLGNVVGEAQKLHSNTEICLTLDVARVLVLVNLEKPLLHTITFEDDPVTKIIVSYPWLPNRCPDCRGWGHTKTECGKLPLSSTPMQVGDVVENKKSLGLREKNKEVLVESDSSGATQDVVVSHGKGIQERLEEPGSPKQSVRGSPSSKLLQFENGDEEPQWTLVTRKGNKRLSQSPVRVDVGAKTTYQSRASQLSLDIITNG